MSFFFRPQMRTIRNYLLRRSWTAGLAIAVFATRLALSPAPAAAATEEASRIEVLEQKVRDLEDQLAQLRKAGVADPARLDEIERQIRILTEEIEGLKLGEAAPEVSESRHGLGPAASRVYGVKRGVSIAGYGEALYEDFDSTRQDGAPSGRTDQLDFLRAVLYAGYKFNDRILLNSEIEFEHATTGEGAEQKGEVSVEFAYLDFLVRRPLNVRAGLLLVPIGFINEQHEPPVFLGGGRPSLEQRMIPTTWRENGLGLFGEAGITAWRAYLVTGLAAVAGTSSGAEGFDSGGIRGGRSEGSNAAAEDLALTGRLDLRPAEGLLLGASFHIGHAGQGMKGPSGETLDARTALVSTHAECRRRGLQARALWVRTTVDDADLINAVQGFTGADSVGERQQGWYAEVGYDALRAVEKTRQSLVPFIRRETFDTQRRVPAGFLRNPERDVTVTTAGLVWKPILNVAVKADYNRFENRARTGANQFNLALGYLF